MAIETTTDSDVYQVRRRNLLIQAAGASATILAPGLSIDVQANDSVQKITRDSREEAFPIVGFMLDGGISQAEFLDAREYPLSDTDSGVGSVPTNTDAVYSRAFEKLAPIGDKLSVVRSVDSPVGHIDALKRLLFNEEEERSIHVDVSLQSELRNEYGYVYFESSFDGKGDALRGVDNKVRKWFDPYHSRESAVWGKYNGSAYEPMKVEPVVPEEVFNRRLHLLNQLNNGHRPLQSPRVEKHQATVRRAIDLIMGRRNDAFDEPPRSKLEQYGDNTFGRAAYIAGKLLNMGAGSIMIRNGHWDMHDNIGRLMLEGGPQLAQAIHALVSDIESGDVSPAVLWAAGEIGRTPKISSSGGRNHWGTSTALFYGGKFKPGVYGETDNLWTPVSKKYPVGDIRHILYHGAGLTTLEDIATSAKHSELFTA